MQLEEYETPDEIFSDYAYFSAYSSSWLEHSERYVELMIERFGFDGSSQVVELASNDGYLLQYFVAARRAGARHRAGRERRARRGGARGPHARGVLRRRHRASRWPSDLKADLLLGNNVLAHVPDLNDFVGGMKILLAEGGVITMEFPHLLQLIELDQFDTIYHEHFSYFSFLTVSRVFEAHGLRLWDVEEIPTHGGSLRIYGCHADDGEKPLSDRAARLMMRERRAGLDDMDVYREFAERMQEDKRGDPAVPHRPQGAGQVDRGLRRAGQGQHAPELLRHPHRLPRLHGRRATRTSRATCCRGRTSRSARVEALRETQPDVVLILPWNLRDEIVAQHGYVREWGGQFAARAPQLKLLP